MPNSLRELQDYFYHGDESLAIRRLSDFVMDTGDLRLFKEALKLYDLFEVQGKNAAGVFSKLLTETELSLKNTESNYNSSQTLIELKNLGKQYSKSNFKIENIDLRVNYGDIVGLVGENGNGKTTLLHLMYGDLVKSAGSIKYHFSKKPNDSYALRSQMVFVPQRIPRWYGSLMDNLKFTNNFYQREGEQNRLWAELMVARLGLRPYRHLTWNRISSGYKTRFEIARVLLRKPKLLLLDEPLANLDIFAQQTLLSDIKYIAQSKVNPFGVILSSQQLYEVEKVSNHLVFLQNGKPKYLNTHNKADLGSNSVFELETQSSSKELLDALKMHDGVSVNFNGGSYVIKVDGSLSSKQFLASIIQHSIDLQSFRNISNSTRRFFEEK